MRITLRSARTAARIPWATFTRDSTIVPAMMIRRIEVTATRVSNTAVTATYIMGPNTADALLMNPKNEKNSPLLDSGVICGEQASGKSLAASDNHSNQHSEQKPLVPGVQPKWLPEVSSHHRGP